MDRWVTARDGPGGGEEEARREESKSQELLWCFFLVSGEMLAGGDCGSQRNILCTQPLRKMFGEHRNIHK